jgi:hypothetical protein
MGMMAVEGCKRTHGDEAVRVNWVVATSYAVCCGGESTVVAKVGRYKRGHLDQVLAGDSRLFAGASVSGAPVNGALAPLCHLCIVNVRARCPVSRRAERVMTLLQRRVRAELC